VEKLDPLPEGLVFDAKLSGPVLKALSAALEGYEMTFSGVATLFFASCPAAIAWLVIAIWIGITIQFMALARGIILNEYLGVLS